MKFSIWHILVLVIVAIAAIPSGSSADISSPCNAPATCSQCFCTNQGQGCSNPCVSDCPSQVIVSGTAPVSCCKKTSNGPKRFTATWTLKQCVCGGSCNNTVVSTCETLTNLVNTGENCTIANPEE